MEFAHHLVQPLMNWTELSLQLHKSATNNDVSNALDFKPQIAVVKDRCVFHTSNKLSVVSHVM